MPSAARLVAAGAGLLAGTALQLQQAALAPDPVLAVLAAAGVAAFAVAVAVGRSAGRDVGGPATARLAAAWLATALGVAALAFAGSSWRAAARLADRLPAALEGRDLEVTGIVAGLPQRGAQAWRFRLEVESGREAGAVVRLPARLALAWYAQPGEALPTLRAGQRWRLPVRLKRPHGLANPHGFDAELYLFEQGVGATGSVRGRRATLLDERAGFRLDRLRQAVRDAIEARVRTGPDGAASSIRPDTAGGPSTSAPAAAGAPTTAAAAGASTTAAPGDAAAWRFEGAREAGVLAALAVGDQAAILESANSLLS